MNNYDQLYGIFQQAREQQQRENFNAFMSGLEIGLVNDLNKAWIEDREHYDTLLINIKKDGIRVFRNEAGKHKLKFM